MVHASAAFHRELPGGERGEAERGGAVAVVRVAHGDHVEVARMEPCHRDGEIIRLGAAVHEVGDVEPLGHFRRELLGEQREVRVQVDRRRVLQRVGLLLDARGDLRVAVAAAHRHDAAEHVEVAAARLVEEPLHVALDDHERFTIEREDRRVRVLLAHRGDFGARGTVVAARLVRAGRHDLRGGGSRWHGGGHLADTSSNCGAA